MDASAEKLFALSFNQDLSCFAIGTKSEGYSLYNVDSFGKIHSLPQGGYGIVEMLYSTSLVALVGLGDQPDLSPRRLQIVNTKRHSTICELTFPTSLLAIRMNRKRLIAVLEQAIYIYDIANMKLLQTLDTTANAMAICALAPNSEQCYIAFPALAGNAPSSAPAHAPGVSAATLTGNLMIYDTLQLQPVGTIEAHKSAVAAAAFNSDGTLLATASDKGTIIRVFSCPDAQKLYQFRRGTLPAKIHNIAFSLDSQFITVASDSETIHIFRLKHDSNAPTGEARPPSRTGKRGPMGMVRKQSQNIGKSFAGTFGSYLPNSVTEMWEPARHFASLKLPRSCTRSVAALHSSLPQVMVLTSGGQFLQYEFDPNTGGDCSLVAEHILLQSP